MFKTVLASLILSASLSASLAACGGGSSDTDTAPVTQLHGQAFAAVVNGRPLPVEGEGQTDTDRQYDAVVFIASTVTPGSLEHRQLLSEGGLTVFLLNTKVVGIARMKADGLHIDLLPVQSH